MKTLFTIGYEGASLADFLATLQVAQISILVDVRDVPLSRKPGFSKKSLAMHLAEIGVDYHHARELGDPKAGREAARKGDYVGFEAIFRDHLARDESQSALACVIDIAISRSACLFCFERDPVVCHRSIVADAVTGRSAFQVKHLGVRGGLASGGRAIRGRQHQLFALG